MKYDSEEMVDAILAQMSKDTRPRTFRDTKPELLVKEHLDATGVIYEQQVSLFGCLWDFVLADRKLLIEVDGCYWHGCPIHHPERAFRRRIDADRTAKASEFGWRVIRVWEHALIRKRRLNVR